MSKALELVYDVNKIYWDNDGNLRYGSTDRKREEEIIQIVKADVNDDDPDRLWIIVPSRWIRRWLMFCNKTGDEPGPIDTFSLLQEDADAPSGWRPKKTLLPASYDPENKTIFRPGHYRRVSLEVWLKLISLHELSGYAIAVHGQPVDDLSRWRVFKNPRNIDLDLLPPPMPITDEKKENEAKKDSGFLSSIFG